LFVAQTRKKVLARRAARHQALAVAVAAREVDPAEVVSKRVAAVCVAVETGLDPPFHPVLVLPFVEESFVHFKSESILDHLLDSGLDPLVFCACRVVQPAPIAIKLSIGFNRFRFWHTRRVIDDGTTERHLLSAIFRFFHETSVANSCIRTLNVTP